MIIINDYKLISLIKKVNLFTNKIKTIMAKPPRPFNISTINKNSNN
jgi:hypothetical protein